MEIREITAAIGKYWDGYAPKFDAEHNTEDLEAWRAALKSLMDTDDALSVLDLGTGTGFLANLAAGLGCSAVGLDLAEEMLKLAVLNASRMRVKAVYLRGDILALPFADNTFDCIVNARLLWTIVSPLKAMREWVRVLKPGGKILCFNRFKDGVGMCGGQAVYSESEVNEATLLANASRETILNLAVTGGFSQPEFKMLTGLTKAEYAADYDPWHVLTGVKPGDPR